MCVWNGRRTAPPAIVIDTARSPIDDVDRRVAATDEAVQGVGQFVEKRWRADAERLAQTPAPWFVLKCPVEDATIWN